MKFYPLLLLICCVTSTVSFTETVVASDNGRTWKKWKVKRVSPAETADPLSVYGGSLTHQIQATGYFYVTKLSDRWWMVDPKGHLYFMMGLNSVEPRRVGRRDAKAWAEDTFELMQNYGFNAVGRWSDEQAFQDAGDPVPWCSTTSFMKEYSKRRSAKNGEKGFPNETLPVFDPEWPKFCEDYAERVIKPLKKDRWLIGHFSDNEIPFRPDALGKYLALPENDPGHQGAREWMRTKGVSDSDIKKERVEQAFLWHVAHLYFATVGEAMRKADPNHMYLGSRLHGRCINPAVITAAGACDIISINYYHEWVPEQERAQNWEAMSGRPFFISEFYAMRVASEKTVPEGVGFRVLTHEDAAAFYQTHTAALLSKVPSCVGWHWFKYADDTPTWQKGVVGKDGTPHQTLLEGMKLINDQVYSLRGLK